MALDLTMYENKVNERRLVQRSNTRIDVRHPKDKNVLLEAGKDMFSCSTSAIGTNTKPTSHRYDKYEKSIQTNVSTY